MAASKKGTASKSTQGASKGKAVVNKAVVKKAAVKKAVVKKAADKKGDAKLSKSKSKTVTIIKSAPAEATFKKLDKKDLLNRKTFTRKGFKPMRPEQIQELKNAESKVGHKLEEIEELSCGCLVLHTDDKGVVRALVLIGEFNGKPYAVLPKGHINVGEDEVSCACRESNEETGTTLTAKNIVLDSKGKPFQEFSGYSFVSPLHRDHWSQHEAYPDESKRPIVLNHKVVRIFLATVKSQKLKPTKGEDSKNKLQWLLIDEVISLMPYEDSKAIIKNLLAQAKIKY